LVLTFLSFFFEIDNWQTDLKKMQSTKSANQNKSENEMISFIT